MTAMTLLRGRGPAVGGGARASAGTARLPGLVVAEDGRPVYDDDRAEDAARHPVANDGAASRRARDPKEIRDVRKRHPSVQR